MADRSINELTQATSLLDSGLTVVYQNSNTYSIAGSALKTYAQNAIAADVQAVSTNTGLCAGYKTDAENAKIAAQAAQSAVENMGVSATNGATASVTKTVTSGVVNLAFVLPSGAMGTITSIAKTGSTTVDGRVVDTYTITCSDGNSYTIQITNGKDGTGTGDMERSVYDPNNAVGSVTGGIPAWGVPQTRKVNGKALTTDITLSSTDIGAVPTTRTINGLALSTNLTLSTVFTTTLSSTGWSTDSNGYKAQTLTVSGIKASYSVNPVVDVSLLGNDATTDAARIEAFALISSVNTAAGSVTALCAGDAPTIDVPIIINVWE